MHIEPLGTESIERYLELRNLRFYLPRDGEDFLLLFSSERCQVHVQVRSLAATGTCWRSVSTALSTTPPATGAGSWSWSTSGT